MKNQKETKNRYGQKDVEANRVIESQNLSNQFKGNFSSKFSPEETIQDSLAKSQQVQAENEQPTYEPDKAF